MRYSTTQAAITLDYFSATGGDGQILIEWETESELSTQGFFVQRSSEENGDYERVSGFIPAEHPYGNPEGEPYSFLDTDVTNGETYFYRLEERENGVAASTFYDPVSATAGTPADTPTATNTPLNTYTPAPTSTGPTPTASDTPTITPTYTPTSTPSRTLVPTRTPFNYQPLTATSTSTNTPTATSTITATATLTPTATLEPLPTFEFGTLATATATPTTTPTRTSTPTLVLQSENAANPDDAENEANFFANLIDSGGLIRIALILMVISAWAVLAIGGYIYLNSRGA